MPQLTISDDLANRLKRIGEENGKPWETVLIDMIRSNIRQCADYGIIAKDAADVEKIEQAAAKLGILCESWRVPGTLWVGFYVERDGDAVRAALGMPSLEDEAEGKA